MKISTWNARSLYRAGSLKAAARELAKCGSRQAWSNSISCRGISLDELGKTTQLVAREVALLTETGSRQVSSTSA